MNTRLPVGLAQRYIVPATGLISQSIRLLLIGLILFLLLLGLHFGISRGYHSMIAKNGHASFWDALCAIHSMERYGAGRYACDTVAMRQVVAAGLYYDDDTLRRYGNSLNVMLRDSAYLDGALAALSNMPNLPSQNSIRGLGWGADAGYLDFLDLSFSLFGKQVSSMYFTYFLLILASTVLFMLAHYRHLLALFCLFALHFGLYRFITVDYFMQAWGVEFVTNPRFVTTFCLIPFLHAAFLIIYRQPISAKTLALLLPQLALMCFAANARSTAYWTIIVMAMLILVLVLWAWFRRRAVRDAVFSAWPAVMAIVVFAAGAILHASAIDPRVKAQGYTNHHSIWTALYYSIQVHPDWKWKYRAQFQNAEGDGVAHFALNSYVTRNNLGIAANPDAYTAEGGLRPDRIDRYLSRAFMEFFWNDPGYVIELFVYYNGYYTLRALRTFVVNLSKLIDWKVYALLFVIAAALLGEIRRGEETFERVLAAAMVLPAFAVLAAGPSWATVVITDSMADPALLSGVAMFVLIMASPVLVWYGIVAALRRLKGRGLIPG